jgi:ATP-dependent DNA helicase RecG
LTRLNWRTTFDEQAVPDLNSEAMDFRAASELFAPYRKLTRQAWSTLRVTTEYQGRQGGVRREDRWSVPLVAIREAVMNAIVHAHYAQQGAPIRVALFDDRIEIENPGLLPFGLTIEDITQGISKMRNRVIGRVFHEIHLIEQWGSGIQRMTAACQKAGLESPRLEEIGAHFRVAMPCARVRQQAEETDGRILALLGDGVARSTATVSKHIGLSQQTILKRLKSMASRGLVVEI